MVGLAPPRIRTVVAVALALAVLAGSGVALSPDRMLVVERVEGGETVISQPIENGTTVALEYTHSVEKSRVYDGYTVRGEKLEMTRMEFESYGWGLPAGANVTRQNGTLVYDPPGTLTELYVSPGEIAGHELHVGDRTYDLVDRADGQSVRIHVEDRSPLDSLT
ncbi:MAG: DUF1850 domain-containing protein [Haloarculaceae archaeon]